MRIAIVFDCVFPSTKGGVERVLRGYAEEWAAQGHEVTYLTRRQSGAAEPAIPGVKVEVIAGSADLYDDTGTRRLGPALAFALALLVALFRRRRDFDAVYVAATPAINVLAARAGLLGSRAVLLTEWVEVWRREQWLEYSGPLVGRLAGAAQALAIRLSRRSVVNSQLHADRLRALRHDGRVFVTPGLLPDDEELGARTRLDPPARAQLLYVGRHIPDKKVELLPAVVADLRRAGRDVIAVVTGDGPTRADAINRARALGVEDACSFPGFVSQEQLDELMMSSSCLVHPSIREGYGLVVVEAAAAGTPVVVVAAVDNAAAELVTDGVNGFVAESPEVGALSRAVASALDGGADLRRTTRTWFDRTARLGTVRASAQGILSALLDPLQR
ncbi:MAG: glycosyltransferase family 4 protein [Blastococcus sp.]